MCVLTMMIYEENNRMDEIGLANPIQVPIYGQTH